MTANIKNLIQSIGVSTPRTISIKRGYSLRDADFGTVAQRLRLLAMQRSIHREIAPAIAANQARFDSLGC